MTVNKKKSSKTNTAENKSIVLPKTLHCVRIPPYLTSLYKRFYMSHKWFSRIDKEWFAKLSTFGSYNKIKASVLYEIKEMTNVLCVGNCYGDFIKDIADKVGEDGSFELVDVIPLQTKNAEKKLLHLPQAKVTLDDIEFYYPKKSRKRIKYDTVVAYFLLHELPDKKKTRVIESLISLTTRSGKVIFVDYNKPAKFNIAKYPVLFINRIIEPFAEVMFNRSIASFTPSPEKYIWKTVTFFGGMYQKTTIKRKRG